MAMKLAPRGWRGWLAALVRLSLFVTIIMASLFTFLQMPGSSFTGPLPPLTGAEQSCATRLARHVQTLATDIGPRNIWTDRAMAQSVAYISAELRGMGYGVSELSFTADGVTSSNLEVEIPGRDRAGEIIVVGAHYDSVFACPGANDNASGVAVLLELARALKTSRPQRTIRLVAFANEEPPFFLSKTMGSRIYAMAAQEQQDDIRAMLALETMGYYSDRPGSQHYPFPLNYFYPDRADFIAFVGNISSRSLVRQAIAAFRRHGHFPSEGLAAPFFVTGVGWSDHWSFWQEGYPAIMVTDTAFYRYEAYHTPEDTAEKLDYARLARVVSGLVPTILELAGGQENTSKREDGQGAGLPATALAQERGGSMISLPAPDQAGHMPLETAIRKRRSVRHYGGQPLTLSQVSQLLWAAQGLTAPAQRRSAPSAGALYPLELYVVCGWVEGLAPGVYHYLPAEHGLECVLEGDVRQQLARRALGQGPVAQAPVSLVLTGVHGRTARKYGERAQRYVDMEVGHVGQNIYLQATALGLGTVMIGAFDDGQVQELLGLRTEQPLAIMPVGTLP